jgi:hypothetical protein
VLTHSDPPAWCPVRDARTDRVNHAGGSEWVGTADTAGIAIRAAAGIS